MNRPRFATRYGLIGMALGLGAPLGALLWRLFFFRQSSISSWLLTEWDLYSFFYGYMAIGSIIVFSIFGFLIGHRNDNLDSENHDVKEKCLTLNQLAVTDGLTGLFNHRFLHEQLVKEMERSVRHRQPLSLLMIDIDDFKAVNDTYGHAAGDAVLEKIADLIRTSVRRIDIVGRYGGEEFAVIMPNTYSDTAHETAERIRFAVKSHRFVLPDAVINLTVSIGLSSVSLLPESKDNSILLKEADAALYDAKRRGKDRICVCDAKSKQVEVLAEY